MKRINLIRDLEKTAVFLLDRVRTTISTSILVPARSSRSRATGKLTIT